MTLDKDEENRRGDLFAQAQTVKLLKSGATDAEILARGISLQDLQAAKLFVGNNGYLDTRVEFDPVTFDQVADALETTIKEDRAPKLITFCAMLLAQTDDDQINVAFQGESSSGKTYHPIEVSQYFPENEFIVLAGASPTSFFHETGEWDDHKKVRRIILTKKILLFLDQPHFTLLERLRPMLSHDKRELVYKITDKSERRGLRTKTVILYGYPCVIFCSGKLDADEQERTRLILLSPSSDQKKLEESLKLLAFKGSDKKKFLEQLASAPKRVWLMELVSSIRSTGMENIKIDSAVDLYAIFKAKHSVLKPRHQRDFPRILSLAKAHALLNWGHRRRDSDGALIADQDDVNEGFRLYEQVSVANELGISPYVLDIYSIVIRPILCAEGITRRDIQNEYYKQFQKFLRPKTLQDELLPALETAGLIIREEDPNDRRVKKIYPPVEAPINSAKETGDNRHPNSGVGICEVCHEACDREIARSGGLHFVHEACEQQWGGNL